MRVYGMSVDIEENNEIGNTRVEIRTESSKGQHVVVMEYPTDHFNPMFDRIFDDMKRKIRQDMLNPSKG